MRCRLLSRGLGVCGVLLASLAGAGEAKPEQLDWPVQSLLLSDVPQVQEPGAVQAQTSLRFWSTSEGAQFDVPMELEVGLGHRLQVAGEVEWSREREEGELERGVSEVGVSVRYGLHESAATGFALAMSLDGELTRAGFSDDAWALYGRLLAFKHVGSLGLNAFLRPGFASTREHRLEPRAEFGLGILWGSGTIVPMAEVLAELGDESGVEAAGGLKIKLGEVVELGAGALVGRRGGEGVFGATTSLLIDLGG